MVSSFTFRLTLRQGVRLGLKIRLRFGPGLGLGLEHTIESLYKLFVGV